jgi:hypothetical protein
MSTNRAVQSAQRRRAGPTNAEPAIPGRGPQPSINSSKIFAGQPPQRPGTQQRPGTKEQQPETLSNINKMTVAQAITLITLRLGSVETKLMNLQNGGQTMSNTFDMDGQENMVLIDKNVVDSIISRLESLEKRSLTPASSSSGPEAALMKQQFENVKQAVMKINTSTNGLIKENKDLKTQISNLRSELNDAKELLQALQNLTMDNSQKLLGLASESFGNIIPYDSLEAEEEDNGLAETTDELFSVGTNLKELIENEMNGNM